MSISLRLLLPRHLYMEMVAHAVSERPNECCGLLGGVVDVERGILDVKKRYPLINEAASRIEYRSEPRSLFLAEKDMRTLGYDRVAVYHSHPTSPPIPSRTDLERSDDPTMVNLIISLMDPIPLVRSWRLLTTTYEEAAWEIVEP